MAEKILKVVWPIPITTSLTGALYSIIAVIKGQHPESEIHIYSIFTGNIEFKGLVFEDVGKNITLNCYSEPNPVQPGYMEITFSVKPK
jgi:hypothetical protein